MQPTSSKLTTTEGKRGFFSEPTELKPTISQPLSHSSAAYGECWAFKSECRRSDTSFSPAVGGTSKSGTVEHRRVQHGGADEDDDSAQYFADERSLPKGLKHCVKILKRKGFSQKAAVEGAKAIGVLAEHKILPLGRVKGILSGLDGPNAGRMNDE
ncbi:hypothetical protein niasHT_035230 [Heterodera trifolii]|uniref:Uncharacterized protein n=1 Tax=Heterodera trifolii TaxID=157864 RepID=A0ABD2J5D3_9BILA